MRFAGYLSFRAKQESILAISIGVDDKGTPITSSSENKIFFAHSALGLVPGLVPGIRIDQDGGGELGSADGLL